MRLRISFILLLFSFPIGSRAEDKSGLILHLKDGSTLIFSVKEKPEITFDGGTMHIATRQLQVADVKKYTFTNLPLTGLYCVEGDANNHGITLKDNMLYIQCPKVGISVICYTVDGIALPVKQTRVNEQTISISLESIPAKVFILTIGNESVKMQKP